MFATVIQVVEARPVTTVLFSLRHDVRAAELDLSVTAVSQKGCILQLSLIGAAETIKVPLPETLFSHGAEPDATKKKRELLVKVPWAVVDTGKRASSELVGVPANNGAADEAAAGDETAGALPAVVSTIYQAAPSSSVHPQAITNGTDSDAVRGGWSVPLATAGIRRDEVATAGAALGGDLPGPFATDACNHCGERRRPLQVCVPCKSVAYCCREHQKEDWKAHKPACLHIRARPGALSTAAVAIQPRYDAATGQQLPAPANMSPAGYSGTFRWGPETAFPPLPPPPAAWTAAAHHAAGSGSASQAATTLLQSVLRQQLAGGWRTFIPWRVPADTSSGNVVVEPMHMDGLSFPAALMWAMAELGLIGTLKPGADAGDSFTVLVAGASERCEQRLLEESAYWAEAAAAVHPLRLRLCIVGPEVSRASHLRDSGKSQPAVTLGEWSSLCYRGTCGGFIREPLGTPAGDAAASVRLVIGYNTGFASGRILLHSWGPDLCDLLDRGIPCVFTCANDFIDGKNEPLVMRAALRAKMVIAPRECPFRAVSTFHAPGKRDQSWCCANSWVYAVQGYVGTESRPTDAELHERLTKVADSLKLESQVAW